MKSILTTAVLVIVTGMVMAQGTIAPEKSSPKTIEPGHAKYPGLLMSEMVTIKFSVPAALLESFTLINTNGVDAIDNSQQISAAAATQHKRFSKIVADSVANRYSQYVIADQQKFFKRQADTVAKAFNKKP
jgi:hypothetical protein